MDKLAVTVPEAVRISGIGRSALYELFRSGQIVPRKRGSRTLILVADLKAYLENLPRVA